jgi:acyl-CoA synthetase
VHYYGAKEAEYILKTVRPDVVITADSFGPTDHLAMYEALLTKHPESAWFVVGTTARDALPPTARPFEDLLERQPLQAPVAVDADTAALIGFTSGTTSDPKGVIHTHNTIVFEIGHVDYVMPKGGPPELTPAPVGHFIALLAALLLPLVRDVPVNLLDAWNPSHVLELMTNDGLAVNGGVPYFLTSLLDHPEFTDQHLAQMPFAAMGGAVVPYAVAERAAKLGMQVYRLYGSTEQPTITAARVGEPGDKCLATEGRPLPAVELRFDDDGQIITRGPDCFMGYTNPELTRRVFDEEGWYHTGDVGVLDEDGFLVITDRVSDIIIRAGENISASEVEEQLLRIDAIAEAAVVSAPDQRVGERVAAVVRLREGCGAPSLEDVRAEFAAAGLAKQKWPESIYTVGDFPRTASGKIQKFRLREQVRAGQFEPESQRSN